MRRITLATLVLGLALAAGPMPGQTAPTRCEGVFYGIEATCMFRLGGPNLLVHGVSYRSESPQAQIVVELWKWPVLLGDAPLARCDTNGGVLRECQQPGGTGLPLNTMLLCRITGIGDIGAFGCLTY